MKKYDIQISVFDGGSESIYQTQVSNLSEFIALTFKHYRQVKYKKPTDKNWYHSKTMAKRLFKSELDIHHDIQFVKSKPKRDFFVPIIFNIDGTINYSIEYLYKKSS